MGTSQSAKPDATITVKLFTDATGEAAGLVTVVSATGLPEEAALRRALCEVYRYLAYVQPEPQPEP